MTRRALIVTAFVLSACGSDPLEPATDTEASDVVSDTADVPVDVLEDGGLAPTPDVSPDSLVTDAAPDVEEPDAAEDSSGDVVSDADQDVPNTEADVERDAPPAVCTTARIEGEWRVEIENDVSIGYRVDLGDSPETFARQLIILFERYSPFPDVGLFDLGAGADSNFGTCAHCVFVRGSSGIQALYAEAGVLDMRRDPYTRTLDLTASALRLVQVDVDRETRVSTPVPGGACLVLGDFEVEQTFADERWTCDSELYNNGVSCECECGAFDPDCAVGGECSPFDPGCEEVPTLPISDCTEAEVCGFDPEAAAPICQETCSWLSRSPCNTGVCVPSTGGSDEDLCLGSDALIHSAQIGEFCDVGTRYQQFCNVVEGYALGYCDYRYECRPVCSSDEECTDEGDACQFFVGPEGFGFCGTIPEDG
ncbi:MAG: hypothetical protein ACJAYU_001864 [Bradymonadia bacterium]|jgi:hypothetical protein